jgi:hypothetical protein
MLDRAHKDTLYVQARDEREQIGESIRTRYVINLDRFLARAKAKP